MLEFEGNTNKNINGINSALMEGRLSNFFANKKWNLTNLSKFKQCMCVCALLSKNAKEKNYNLFIELSAFMKC